MTENINYNILESSKIAGKCQRNWIDSPIDEFDLNTIVEACMNMPTKQNVLMYELVVVQDKESREFLYDNSDVPELPQTHHTRWRNGQMNAPTILMWFRSSVLNHKKYWNTLSHTRQDLINLNAGISMGAAALTATQLGYFVGFNCCFSSLEKINEFGKKVNTEFDDRSFLCALGIGKPIKDLSRNVVPKNKHLKNDLVIETMEKHKKKIVHYI